MIGEGIIPRGGRVQTGLYPAIYIIICSLKTKTLPHQLRELNIIIILLHGNIIVIICISH